MTAARFEWDPDKNVKNQEKHGVSFYDAQFAFADPNRVIADDNAHRDAEQRYFCFGELNGGIVTVRFTYRVGAIRIYGAGYWRKGKIIYERESKIQ